MPAVLCWCVFTSVSTIICGFTLAEWTTPAALQYQVEIAKRAAVLDLAVEACMYRFRADLNREANYLELADQPPFNRPRIIEKGGWAMIGVRQEPIPGVAALCANRLVEARLDPAMNLRMADSSSDGVEPEQPG